MTTPQATQLPSVRIQVPTGNDIVEFVHGLGGDVDITAFDATGDPAPFGIVIPISDDEVAVHVHPGQVDALVATLAPPEDDTE
jgi:hypothetical protein